MDTNTSYQLDVLCKNCDFRGKENIPKGTKVEEHTCPNCGTIELERDFNANLGESGTILSF